MPDIAVYNHQDRVTLTNELLARFESAAKASLMGVLEHRIGSRSVIQDLDEIEVSLIDDETIASVHEQFMSIPGATDVITFEHGEIHVGVETAVRQASEFSNDVDREIMLYIIHGLLHLAGHLDAKPDDQDRMNQIQEQLLNLVWSD
ncbi:rRNA maturation RNase YbeY [Verrucomicrobiaceae bacterium N1E253]|uniref:Endoribonuclease YbeY n=1 Tax=Oceaniferula marina TaxID=2748318 RepID=A0A851GJG8_9BACT|nr:rRNA maturation RNase YbeY [Oceaniferula marina]NWK54334.1 rRNA maturation RNase YbeY [Oceaniferula marina]